MIPALTPTYNRASLAFERGEGAWLYTTDGRRFLDFAAGIATCSIGHAHPHMVSELTGQIGRVMHVSNLFQIPQAIRLAERLVANSFADSVFFCNSGAEANEGMVKFARRAQALSGHPERTDIICMDGAFHGRTLAMLSATGNPKYLEGFGTPVPGFVHVPFNDIAALKAAITPQTAAIMLEPFREKAVSRLQARSISKQFAPCVMKPECCWHWMKYSAAWAGQANCLRMNGPALRRMSCPPPKVWAGAFPSARFWRRKPSRRT